MKGCFLFAVLLLILLPLEGRAQLGEGWSEYHPEAVLHLGTEKGDKRHVTRTSEGGQSESLGDAVKARYRREGGEGIERFDLKKPGERAEVRLKNDYRKGARQFEGWVTIEAPIERQMIFQIWGSGEKDRATQFFLRGYHNDGGTLRAFIAGASARDVASQCYGREIRVNVIHLQEDEGGRILLYLDGHLVLDEPDAFPKIINNEGGNYHKYGCYGTFEGDHKTAGTAWRHVRHFEGGKLPEE